MNYAEFFKYYFEMYPEEIGKVNLINFAKAVIAANNEYNWQANRLQCAFCYEKLTHEDHQFLSPYHFRNTCKKHNEYADVFQIRLIQERLGLPTSDPNYKGFFDK